MHHDREDQEFQIEAAVPILQAVAGGDVRGELVYQHGCQAKAHLSLQMDLISGVHAMDRPQEQVHDWAAGVD